MKSVLLTLLLTLPAFLSQGQTTADGVSMTPSKFDWMIRIGLNALDQSHSSDFVSSKSALGFQIGGDVIWSKGWKYKGGLQYQYHEVFEINENNTIITNAETRDRNFQRIKISAGTIYDIVNIDYLTIGIGADLAYNVDLSDQTVSYARFDTSFDLDYFSSLFHLYVNIKHIQIDLGIEGNILSVNNTSLRPFQSKTYSLTLGYIF